jgi:hypothetical protein
MESWGCLRHPRPPESLLGGSLAEQLAHHRDLPLQLRLDFRRERIGCVLGAEEFECELVTTEQTADLLEIALASEVVA